MSPLAVIDKFYPADDELRRLLLKHSWQVASHALCCASRHPLLRLDANLLLRGGLLHDIGVVATNAPTIYCHGTAPYIAHGVIGAQMLREMGLEREARFCERHTGTGLTPQDITRQNLPLEPRDYQPETLEEQLICYADKFYSKSRPDKMKTFQQVCTDIARYGSDGVDKFIKWHQMFN